MVAAADQIDPALALDACHRHGDAAGGNAVGFTCLGGEQLDFDQPQGGWLGQLPSQSPGDTDRDAKALHEDLQIRGSADAEPGCDNLHITQT